jgi:hypothetical protein
MNKIIPPEIDNDSLSEAITGIISSCLDMENILEIGSSSGLGSTDAIVKGVGSRKGVRVFCLEASRERFEEFKKNRKESFIIPYNYSSVGLKDYLDSHQVSKFYSFNKTNLNNYSLSTVLSWREKEIEYISKHRIPLYGISNISEHFNILSWDLAIIDGSGFTAQAELKKLINRTNWIILDDINALKNFDNYRVLNGHWNYKLVTENRSLRNGYAIFKRKGNES